MRKRKDTMRVAVDGKLEIIQSAGAAGCGAPERMKVKNISRGGFCAVSEKRICRDEVFEAELFLNDDGSKRLKVFCRAAWSEKHAAGGEYATGMQFVGLKARDCGFLKEFLNSKLPYYMPQQGRVKYIV